MCENDGVHIDPFDWPSARPMRKLSRNLILFFSEKEKKFFSANRIDRLEFFKADVFFSLDRSIESTMSRRVDRFSSLLSSLLSFSRHRRRTREKERNVCQTKVVGEKRSRNGGASAVISPVVLRLFLEVADKFPCRSS